MPKKKLSAYAKKLLDPRWQRKRLEVLEGSAWTCSWCGSKHKTLHVHHGYYRRDADPWDYDDEYFHALCHCCHEKAEFERSELYRVIGMIPPSKVSRLFEQTVIYAGECLPGKVEEWANAPSDPETEVDPSLMEEASLEELGDFFAGLKHLLGDK